MHTRIPDISIMSPPLIGPDSGSLLFAAKLRMYFLSYAQKIHRNVLLFKFLADSSKRICSMYFVYLQYV